MTGTVLLANALCLSSADWQALTQGRMIAAMPWNFIIPGQSFALYSRSVNNTNTTFWARCEFCKSIDDLTSLNTLSKLTVWTEQALKHNLKQREFFFLAGLRVYEMPQSVEVTTATGGEFLPLAEPTMVSESRPVINDSIFQKRRQQLEELKPPLHPELEELLIYLTGFDEADKALEQDIKMFLGWADYSVPEPDPNLVWITTIVGLGKRSKDLDEGKSNYQAGTDFENIVHKSLEFLGFTIDEAHKGGAGGLDLFCSKPYPLVGECKAGKGIPSRTTEELIKLGGMRLGKDQFLASAKLIIGSGVPTSDVLKASQEWRVSIINPMSLQKLVELKAKYPGSIDLIELKKYLEPGQIDHKIGEYIEKVIAEIKLRAHITQILKKYLEQFRATDVDLNTLFGVYCGSTPPSVLTPQEFHKILIELSSPLTGYLGRRKGNDGRDRFYYLRDLPVE